ncbi:MAG: lasso peptide biosynthesis B2 protein [Cellvibrionaceae bacterium]|nr:lasso peptide biosynthesis B2 protein [Cellvibrionaceae bacterium]
MKLLWFGEAWLNFAWVDFRISVTPYARWKNYFLAAGQPAFNLRTARNVPNINRVRQIIRSCELAKKYHWRDMNCLRRCFVQQQMLQRRNINSQLHIGVKKQRGQLAAHAWLSHQGQIINDSQAVIASYAELHAPAWNGMAQCMGPTEAIEQP